MSSKGTRKSHTAALSEDKEKRQTDSPVKEMKKKMAANAEKEKQTSEKTDKHDKVDKTTEKPDKAAEKTQNEKEKTAATPEKHQKADKTAVTPDKNQKADKVSEKQDKNAQKPADKNDKSAQKLDKSLEKTVEKKSEKVADKKTEKPAEKKNEPEKKEEGKVEANGKDKPETSPKQNGKPHEANGDTVSESSEEDLALVIDDQDELFPELAYDDDDDEDEHAAPSRSLTRRSQVKATKTPETPRPASFKEDDSKEKATKNADALATDRKLRSADSPKPEAKKPEQITQKKDSSKNDKTIDLTEDEKKDKTVDLTEEKSGKSGEKKLEMEVVVEIEPMEGEVRSGGVKTRARVSPYTRSAKHDQTTTSVTANYTGNNTTMEMDITESSIMEEANLDDSYLRGLRTIKARSSYKPLTELALKHTLNRSTRSSASTNTSLPIIELARPTGTVVGRKRKPDADDSIEWAQEASEPGSDVTGGEEDLLYAHTKRMRLFDRFSVPFRGFTTRRAAEIVGINTDLPLSAPVASPGFDPETLKPEPLPTATHDRDTKKCIVM